MGEFLLHIKDEGQTSQDSSDWWIHCQGSYGNPHPKIRNSVLPVSFMNGKCRNLLIVNVNIVSSKDSNNSSNTDFKYPVYKEVLHNYKSKAGTERTSKRVNDCPVFKSSDDDHKKDLLDILKKKHSLCSRCSSWTHEAKDCNQTFTCYDCQGEPLSLFEMFLMDSWSQGLQPDLHLLQLSRRSSKGPLYYT